MMMIRVVTFVVFKIIQFCIVLSSTINILILLRVNSSTEGNLNSEKPFTLTETNICDL